MSKVLQGKLKRYFPHQEYNDSDIEAALANGEILTVKTDILPFLQIALLDEKVLEVELDAIPNTHFSRLKDDLPEGEEEESIETTEAETDSVAEGEEGLEEEEGYQQGDYLLAMNHLVILPLEPGLGNLHLRHSRFIVLRMFIKISFRSFHNFILS